MKNYSFLQKFNLFLKPIFLSVAFVFIFSAFPSNAIATGHDYGYIRVCKIITTESGQIATTTQNLPNSSFSIKIANDKHISQSTVLEYNFSSTNWIPNTKITSVNNNDAHCITKKVIVGEYYYSEEFISEDASRWNTPKYYDGTDSALVLSSASEYTSQLYNSDDTDDYLANIHSDGFISVLNGRTRTIVVLNTYKKANTPPQISIIGSNPINLTVGESFLEPGATATDTEDGNLTSSIVYTGSVGTIAGTYTLTYTVTDSGGLSASTTRNVVFSPATSTVGIIDTANIVATKIVCDSESDLPDWNGLGLEITASTSSEFLSTHPNCHSMSDWKFQWGLNGQVTDPGSSFIGEAPISSGWNTFGPTDSYGNAVTTISHTTELVWFREVLKDGYVPFSFPENTAFSAEMYCDKDVLNYDNYDYIEGLSKGQTYYCIAFNALNVSTTTLPINTPPQISIIGSNPINLTVGESFLEPGATATDTEDGNLTSSIVYTGSVGTIAGTYTLTYTVTDSGGLSASTTRTVIISNPVSTLKGKLKFCASFADQDNVIATTSSQIPTGTFKLNVATSTNFASSTINSKTWTNLDFVPTHKILLNTEKDAECIIWDNLELGTYYYSDVLVSGSVWDIKQFSDQFNQPVNNIFDLFNYSPELFNATSTDDASRNPNSDGMIEVSASQREHTIVIVFKHKKVTQNPLQCLIPEITSSLAPAGIAGQAFSYQLTASSTATTTLALSIGTSTLPAGLTFSTTTNIISGTPTDIGTFVINVQATNSCGVTNSQVTINISTPPGGGGGGGGCTSNCGGSSVSTGGGGGGGNGPIVQDTLKIFNEKVIEVTPGIALVTWDTNLSATRQVGYGTSSVVSASSTAPFGYATSTTEITLLSKTHSFSIPIESGKTYYFRPVSRDTLSTVIGKELILNPQTTGGVSAPNQCYYLFDYLKKGWNNNPVEVKKLQVFLRDLEGYKVLITGVYDDQTIEALNAFQEKYSGDILTPWGHTEATSFTYITTKKKVNEIYCKRAFPVTVEQQAEIDSFKAFLGGLKDAGIILPSDPSIDYGTGLPVIDTTEVGGIGGGNDDLAIEDNLTDDQTTLAGVSTTTSNLTSRFTAAVISSGKTLGSWASYIFTWPWKWSERLFGSNDEQCQPNTYGSLLNWILIIIIIVLAYLWLKERRSYKTSMELNKELDLNK